MARRTRTHTLTPRHLAVLQWMEQHSVTPERPNGWCSEKRIQANIRVNGEKLAIGEALHDLTYKLNEKDEPFIIVHPNSDKHYRISAVGRKIARTCTTKAITTELGEQQVVIDSRTGKPPRITSADFVETAEPQELEDDDEFEQILDDSEVVQQPARKPAPATPATLDTRDADAIPAEEDNPPETYDEINDGPRLRPKTNPAKKPPARKPMPAIGKPAAPKTK